LCIPLLYPDEMRGVRRCDTHGFFAAEICPNCGDPGDPVLSGDQRGTLSRFLSYALRHDPDDAGIEVTGAGWAEVEAVAAAVSEQYDWADETGVDGVVAADPKGRFEVDGGRIRAAYGHSIDVSLGPTDRPVPDTLYHGTDPDALPQIRRQGLRPMTRQLVHLSGTEAAALDVGRRHAADPALLVIDAVGMLTEGRTITKRGGDVYTTERVPPAFITRAGEAAE
jgi:putative RNA 2'-phosphotransferase